jgi:hypothetical protein
MATSTTPPLVQSFFDFLPPDLFEHFCKHYLLRLDDSDLENIRESLDVFFVGLFIDKRFNRKISALRSYIVSESKRIVYVKLSNIWDKQRNILLESAGDAMAFRGNPKLVDWFCDFLRVPQSEDWPYFAIESNSLSVVQHLKERHAGCWTTDMTLENMNVAAARAKEEIFKWLEQADSGVQVALQSSRDKLGALAGSAARGGSIRLLEYICGQASKYNYLNISSMYRMASGHGRLPVLEWLYNTFPRSILRYCDSDCAVRAADEGHWNAVRWIYEHAQVFPLEILSGMYSADVVPESELRWLLQYFVREYGNRVLPEPDVIDSKNDARVAVVRAIHAETKAAYPLKQMWAYNYMPMNQRRWSKDEDRSLFAPHDFEGQVPLVLDGSGGDNEHHQ